MRGIRNLVLMGLKSHLLSFNVRELDCPQDLILCQPSTNPIMKTAKTKVLTILLIAVAIASDLRSARALEPQTLFNFELSPGTVTASLVEGPDGNFYGTTAQGGPRGSGTVFRVTPAGVLTTLVSDQANPAAGLVVGNDGLLYGMASAGGGLGGFGSVFKMTTDGVLTTFAVFDGGTAAIRNPDWCWREMGISMALLRGRHQLGGEHVSRDACRSRDVADLI